MATPETKINRSDLQFFPSERLTDNDDGGGMPLGTPISGEANELFNPISSIARVNGGFYARLMYAGVQRADDEPLIGSFAAITKPPTDPTVSYLMFPATKFGELRHEILDRIEAYNVGTIESRMTLLSTQSQNSRIVQAYQTPGEPLPLIGDVYCLTQDKAGYSKVEQYVQVTNLDSEDREFTDPNGKKFTKTVLKISTSGRLQHDFIGAVYPKEGYIDNPCKIRETGVADAAQYYGVKPLAAPIVKDEPFLKIASLMDKVVPTNQIEQRLRDLTAAGQRQTLFDSARAGNDGIVSLGINKTHNAGAISNIYLGNAATPDSIKLDTAAGVATDKGGVISIGGKTIGSVDYGRGTLLLSEPTFSSRLNNVSFRPSLSEQRVADTDSIPIAINNRGYTYGINIDPPPAPSSLQVSYMAQGNWYDLRDDGTGNLRGSSEAHGGGTVSYITGSADIDCGEMPDVGSAIIFSWSTRARYFNRAGGVANAKMLLQLANDIDPSSLTLTWNDGVAKTATSDAAGNITGDWTGKLDVQTNQIRIDAGANFNHPAGVLDVSASYSKGDKKTKDFTAPLRDAQGKINLDMGDTPIKPNTFRLRYNLLIEDYDSSVKTLVDPYKVMRDDGVGNLIDETGINMGTIDYVTRKVQFSPETTVQIPKTVYKTVNMGDNQVRQLFSHFEYVPAGAFMPYDESSKVETWFYDTSPTSTVTEALTSGDIEIDLLPQFAETVAPSSLAVTWGGSRYFDRAGTVYTNIDPNTGSADVAGTIDYSTGRLLLTRWDWTSGAAPNIISLASSIDGNPVDAVTFRTPSAPLQPGSLNVRATGVDGSKINITADFGGAMKSARVDGTVDAEFGVARLRFGKMVAAAGNESEPWYDADAVVDGMIWQSLHVFAETVTYNATSYTYLPIDSSVVKIDTVRLPQDGRIPIFRRGDTIIIGNRQTTDIGSAHTGGQTVTLPRDDVTRIAVSDAADTPVNAELWDYDLAAGTITWRTPLDLSMYKMPLKVMHAQEERNRIIQPDIDGTLTLLFAMRRSYPIADTYVSSVLIGGDLQVRVSIPFTQKSWDNVWRDEPKGDQLLNKLNLKDHPMILTDDGAIKERWMIKMTGTAQFELYGETLGFVMRGDTLTDLAPINPANNVPYFTLPKQAFGADAPWANQDIIRFNTWGTLLPVWVLCAVQPNPNPPTGTDGYTQCLYGDTTELLV
ncbi:hypothetical protein [Psychrobacter aquimaris]|uniref:hypothetical protein n=1 Tax=Psychrobacter aquimaris TaxID=292733 RepID=UPI0018E02C5F|nr:hypothetical protein [Psychrobacter aquimaris]